VQAYLRLQVESRGKFGCHVDILGKHLSSAPTCLSCLRILVHLFFILFSLSSHIMFLLLVRFEVFTAVTMKKGVFWDVTPCDSCKNGRFGGTWRLLHQCDKNL
jgi:hypothetical protein